ncbi:hypothetical protein GCM10009037_02830 [Halarchaeum grantii]|uniref:DUF7123 domain-containing protein n=1 Tax=Halarchaeum grantii TaxID=1193105 RepID=A0A830F5I4_9EURY|nr:hypothetical protein [Halarchaeum grantii]GGL22817.1 hypothetical protein GCM10009037_02830 [Halarchaeum grantii]
MDCDDRHDRNPKALRLERYLRARVRDGAFYCKSKDIAADVALTPSEIGQFLPRFDGERGVVVERWAYSGGTRWHVRPAEE